MSDTVVKADDLISRLKSRITNPSELSRLKAVIYSRTGVGKTWFGASAPKPLHYDVDGTTVSLAKSSYSSTAVLPFVSLPQCELVIKNWEERFSEFDTLVIDSGSQYSKRVQEKLMEIQGGNTDPSNTTLAQWLNVDINYNALTKYMTDWIESLNRLPCHVVMTAHVTEVKDDSTGRISFKPDFTAKVYAQVARWANVIGYLESDGENRSLRIRPNQRVDAKTHIGGPAVLENPTFNTLLELARSNA